MIVAKLNSYLKRKQGKGWTAKVVHFQTMVLPPIKKRQDLDGLIRATQKLCDSLWSFWNETTGYGGSSLKKSLEDVLCDIKAGKLEAPAAICASKKTAQCLSMESHSKPIPIPNRRGSDPQGLFLAYSASLSPSYQSPLQIFVHTPAQSISVSQAPSQVSEGSSQVSSQASSRIAYHRAISRGPSFDGEPLLVAEISTNKKAKKTQSL